MKNIWLYSLRLYLKVGLFFYFKKFKVVGRENIPRGKALLVLGNHQSALIDPLLLAVTFKQFAYYLTRAGVFKKKFVSVLLNSVNMLPVYRIRDGWSNLTNNNPVFEKCEQLLKDDKTIVIFPEGSHNLRRTVRPLSKGFTRIILDTLEKYPNTDLYLLPAGFNYQDAIGFPDSVSVYYGKPIRVDDLLSDNIHENVMTLKETVHHELTKLTTHIPTEKYEETLEQLNKLQVDFTRPEKVNACINTNLEECAFSKKKKSFLGPILKLLVYLNVIVPFFVWRLVRPQIKELEFVATFRFAVAMVLIPIWLVIIAYILFSMFGGLVALLYVICFLFLILLYVKA